MKGLAGMINDLLKALREAGIEVEAGVAKRIEIKMRSQYGGERIYIQSLPKQLRAAQVSSATSAMGTAARRLADLSRATGIPTRTIKRLRNGR